MYVHAVFATVCTAEAAVQQCDNYCKPVYQEGACELSFSCINNVQHRERERQRAICSNWCAGAGAQDVVNDCIVNNPAEIFGYNASGWATTESILATLNNRQLWDADLTGQGFTLDQVCLQNFIAYTARPFV